MSNDPARLAGSNTWLAAPRAPADQQHGAANLASPGSDEVAYEGKPDIQDPRNLCQ